MTRALVTQMLNALEHHQSQTRPIHKTEFAITAAREYLAAEPSGERAELIARLAKQWAELDPADPYRADVGQAADMLEADADLRTQLARRTVERDMAISMIGDCIDEQQAKRVQMTFEEVENCFPEGATSDAGYVQVSAQWTHDFARAIEAHHGITPADKPTDWSAA